MASSSTGLRDMINRLSSGKACSQSDASVLPRHRPSINFDILIRV